MKRLMMATMCAALCNGCNVNHDDGTYVRLDGSIVIKTVRGHDYVVARCVRGISIVHAASCPCVCGKADERVENGIVGVHAGSIAQPNQEGK